MPTSLFQYEMLPTTWFYLSSILILASFFRFNCLFSVRNFDVLALISLTPGLIYLAMGSTFQGYLWLWCVGMIIFVRLALDVFLRRRPILAPNLSFQGLAFSCAAATAFIIPNLFLNRGDACESPQGWRLEQIMTASEESETSFTLKNWPGYRPFLLATQKVNRFFAPSQEFWNAAVAELRERNSRMEVVKFFGWTISLEGKDVERRRAARAMQLAAGMTNGRAFDFERNPSDLEDNKDGVSDQTIEPLDSLQAVPTAPLAPAADERRDLDASEQIVASNARIPSSETPNANASRPPQVKNEANLEEPSAGPIRSLTLDGFFLILLVTFFQIGIIVVIILIGRYHFDSLQTGLACGLFYLLLPYINQFSARLDHIVPAFAILLAALFYRRPFVSGIALGVAGSLVFYPFFLIPIWLGFYWKKGAARFTMGLTAAVLTLAVAMLFMENSEIGLYGKALGSMFGRHSLFLAEADGLWEFLPRFYRVPLIAVYVVYCLGFAIWTPRKNFATLLSCSAALMLGVQFWMGRQGGLYMSWYLPLVVLTVFRPNLDDRVASTTVIDV